MVRKNLESKTALCASALISGLNQPKEEVGIQDNTTYIPCMRRLGYMTKEELGLIKRYSRNEKVHYKRRNRKG